MPMEPLVTSRPPSLQQPATRRSPPPEVSVVLPVRDEAENLPPLYRELVQALEGTGRTWEAIFVDDGSTDDSPRMLIALAHEDPRIRVIKFRRNYGQTAALSAGFAAAAAPIIVTLDADLQNDPADIPRLLDRLEEGYDLVSGWRRDRKDPLLTRRIPSGAANRLINKLIEGTGIALHDYGCTLKAYRASLVKRLALYGEMHRFIPAFAAWYGVSVAEIQVNHRPRQAGQSKYGLGRTGRVLLDLIAVRFFTDRFTRPVQFFGKIAFGILAGGLLLSFLLLGARLLLHLDVGLGSLVLVPLVTVLSSIHLVVLGLVGELFIRGFQGGGRLPTHVIETTFPPTRGDAPPP